MNKTFAFIDASNLFYGGEKSLGWKIDYRKFLEYLKEKYNVSKAFYFGGIEIHDFPYNYLTNGTVPIKDVEEYVLDIIENTSASGSSNNFNRAVTSLIWCIASFIELY